MLQTGQDAKTAAKSQEIRNETKRLWEKQQDLAKELADLDKKQAGGSVRVVCNEREWATRSSVWEFVGVASHLLCVSRLLLLFLLPGGTRNNRRRSVRMRCVCAISWWTR